MKKGKIYLSIFLTFFATLTSCTNHENDNETRSYADYPEFALPSIDEMYELKDVEYYVEYYFPECPHCQNIRSSIYNYMDKVKNGDENIPLYYFNIENGSTSNGSINRSKFKIKPNSYNRDVLVSQMIREKVSKVSDTYFFGTPSLYVIKNGVLADFYIGEVDIPAFLGY